MICFFLPIITSVNVYFFLTIYKPYSQTIPLIPQQHKPLVSKEQYRKLIFNNAYKVFSLTKYR